MHIKIKIYFQACLIFLANCMMYLPTCGLIITREVPEYLDRWRYVGSLNFHKFGTIVENNSKYLKQIRFFLLID